MPPRKKNSNADISDYRHAEKRKNIPPAGLAAQGKVKDAPRTRYSYDPHLPPVLRFDPTGAADQLPELLEAAQQRPLTLAESQLLAEALRNRQPWLEWAGKREQDGFEVDPVALHIHERVSAQAVLKLAQREPMQRSLFADPELDYRQAIQFYQHDVDWANRLILGDSLTVMNSLARREDLAGKVQMIYIDPPYGINFKSNFQSQVGVRDVKDKSDDLTRQQEQVRAYRDTWTLGVHTYLAYMRDRLLLSKELLSDTGSIFVQISDENLDRIRLLLDEVFGAENFIAVIPFRKKTMPLGANVLEQMLDFLIWYAKDKSQIKYHQLYRTQNVEGDFHWKWYETRDAIRKTMGLSELDNHSELPADIRPYRLVSMSPPTFSSAAVYPFSFEGQDVLPPKGGCWITAAEGMKRLAAANRIQREGQNLRYCLFLDDYPLTKLTTLWSDTIGARDRMYVVQTSDLVIERCLLMTTDPGDLVLDPTCGSGTTAFVAEQWGRRWITIDTSRVAVALARQRLLTAKYDYFELSNPDKGPEAGFVYKTVPHITLKSIAQNQALDPIFAKWEPLLAQKLAALNAALNAVTPAIRAKLAAKLAEKERREGKSSLTDADRRRLLLPSTAGGRAGDEGGWKEWQVPFDTDPDWPAPLAAALEDYRKTWRGKMDEVNAAIAASAPQETLVDQPRVTNNVLRVSGPFTVEGVQPIEETLDLDSPIGGEPEELETFPNYEPANAEAYLEKMIRLLKADGVRFPDNKVLKFERLDPLPRSLMHAEGEWKIDEVTQHVGVSFGPQYGPITAQQVEECLREAYRRGFDALVFAGFSIDGAAQAIIQDDPNPAVRCHLAHIRPDVNMGGLLKDTPGSQLFTVFGLPRVELIEQPDGEYVVDMQGVDIYDPVSNALQPTRADKVAAWFLDSDYDGRTFCITQAFFPDSTAWDKLARALKTQVDPERFAAFSGTTSLPFTPGKNKRIAVKVIDPRGNEVMRVMGVG